MKHARLESILSKWVEDYNKYHKVKLTKNTFKDDKRRSKTTVH